MMLLIPSVVAAVVTTIIYTAPPDATVIATVGVQQSTIQSVSIVDVVTETVAGTATQTVAPIGIFFNCSN